MIDRIIYIISVTIIILAIGLLLSSGVGFFIDLAAFPMATWQAYAGWTLLALSFLLAALNLIFAGHPLYEYWLTVLVGGIIAVCYLS